MGFSANELRPGNVIDHEGQLWLCLESVHKTPGNLRAFVQAKMRNIKQGNQKDFRFSSTEDLVRVDLRERAAQFLYEQDSIYNFMDTETYDQFTLSKDLLGESVWYLLPEMTVQITFFDETPLSVKLPRTMAFDVIEAEPNMKSSTATSSYKTAKIQTGKAVKVPQFVETGDRIIVDTESGDYLERAKNR